MLADRQVIVAEMQAHGRTRDIARPLSFEAMADDVSGLLKHLQVDSAGILGYSMGVQYGRRCGFPVCRAPPTSE